MAKWKRFVVTYDGTVEAILDKKSFGVVIEDWLKENTAGQYRIRTRVLPGDDNWFAPQYEVKISIMEGPYLTMFLLKWGYLF